MKKFLYVCLFLALLGPPAFAQNGITGNLTAASTDCTTTNSCLILHIPEGMGGATIGLSGTFSATLQFEGSADPLTVVESSAVYRAMLATPSNSSTAASSATAGGIWQVNVSAYKRIRVRVSAYTSGTVAAEINLGIPSARGGSGGGGGGSSILSCSTTGGVIYENGTPNTGTCNPNFTLTAAGNFLQLAGAGGGTFGGLGPALEQLNVTDGDVTFHTAFTNTAAPANVVMLQGVQNSGVSYMSGYWTATNFGEVAIGPDPIGVLLQGDGTGNAQGNLHVLATGAVQVHPGTGQMFCLMSTNVGTGSVCLDPGTTGATLTSTKPFVVGPDGVHPGNVALVGNTTVVTPAANTVNFMGPSSAAFTAYGLQYSATGPAAAGIPHVGAPSSAVSQVTFSPIVGADMTNATVTATQLAAQYSKWEACGSRGLGDGLNAIAAGTYLQFACVNDTGVTVTITGLRCWTDNNGTSTMNAANNAASSFLTGAVTCTNTKASGGAAGTQSATTTLASGDAISFTFVADGTSKQTNWTVSGTY